MKIVIPGGSGQVGTILARAFHGEGHEVVVLSRSPRRAPWRTVAWDAVSPGPWTAEIEESDVLIHLTGRSVDCRYTPANRKEILESRVVSTRLVGEVLAAAKRPPRLWLQASTATIYAHRYDAANDEATGILGGSEPGAPDTWNFSIDVATSWERAAVSVDLPRTRLVLMRSAMTMSPDPGGVFATLLRLVRLGLGGRAGDGRQYVSWIHDADFVSSVRFLIDREDLAGPVNLASPNPLPYADFMRELRKAWGMPVGLPATEWMVEIGTFLMRSESELVLKSRRVVPGKLLESGFAFRFPHWDPAAQDLCERWKAA